MDGRIYEKLAPDEQKWADRTWDKICNKLEAVRERSANKIPSGAADGVHDNKVIDEGPTSYTKGFWTNGFWAGMMWQMHYATKDERYAEIARYTETVLDECIPEIDILGHDLGYLWLPSAVLDYKITGDKTSLRRGLMAANALAGRFNPAGEYIVAWPMNPLKTFLPDHASLNINGATIIDCMLNLPLLYWASDMTGDPRFKIVGQKHADKTMENFIREDGSVIHIVEFDPESGDFVRDYGGQGYKKGSAWTRGQAWGLYGFTVSYKHTGKQEYLKTAKRIAEYFISHIPESGLIPSDFCQPPAPYVQDDIAASAAASGLTELAGLVPEEEGHIYLESALKLLRAIDEKSSDWSRETDGITLNGTGAYHFPGKNTNFIYADYFYVEAVLKLRGQGISVW